MTDPVQSHRCDDCGFQATSKYALKRHRQVCKERLRFTSLPRAAPVGVGPDGRLIPGYVPTDPYRFQGFAEPHYKHPSTKRRRDLEGE
jgi:hypothetical protein